MAEYTSLVCGLRRSIVKSCYRDDHADIPAGQVHHHLPENVDGEESPRIDCFVVDEETSIPENIQPRYIIVVATSVKSCEEFAKSCREVQVRGFVLQENR